MSTVALELDDGLIALLREANENHSVPDAVSEGVQKVGRGGSLPPWHGNATRPT